MRPLMGTFVEICIDGDQQAINAAFAEIETIDRLMSFHQPDSELSQLNRSAGVAKAVHHHTFNVFKLAKDLMEKTDGKFNCTVAGALVRRGMLPDHQSHFELEVGTAEDIQFEQDKIILTRPILVTLDGIAKGYAIDQAVEILMQHGVTSGWVNAGGDLRVFGNMATPIHRRELDNSLSYIGHLSNIAVATSSVVDGYDARFPGMVVDSSLRFRKGIWSVKAPQAWLADALTKVAAVTQPEKMKSVISDLGGELVYGLGL